MDARILFVEDETSAHFAVREYFAAKGFRVDCARDQEAALQFLSTARYSVVIVELRLSENEGRSRVVDRLEIVERIRRQHPGTRVLVLTACEAELEPEALRRGADCFLQKPQSLARVAGVVERLLRTTS